MKEKVIVGSDESVFYHPPPPPSDPVHLDFDIVNPFKVSAAMALVLLIPTLGHLVWRRRKHRYGGLGQPDLGRNLDLAMKEDQLDDDENVDENDGDPEEPFSDVPLEASARLSSIQEARERAQRQTEEIRAKVAMLDAKTSALRKQRAGLYAIGMQVMVVKLKENTQHNHQVGIVRKVNHETNKVSASTWLAPSSHRSACLNQRMRNQSPVSTWLQCSCPVQLSETGLVPAALCGDGADMCSPHAQS